MADHLGPNFNLTWRRTKKEYYSNDIGLKLVDNHKIHITGLNAKISNLEQEKYNIAKQKDQTIDILSKELNKGVNINYLRNILISFLISKEESVIDLFNNSDSGRFAASNLYCITI